MATLGELKARANEQGKRHGIPALGDLIVAKAERYGIEPDVFLSLINYESGYNPRAYNPSGAAGLGQVMPFHFQAGEDPFDVETNLDRSASILADYTNRVGGNKGLGLAAYFSGVDPVLNAGGQIPETRDPNVDTRTYVRTILQQAGRDDLVEKTPGLYRRAPGLGSPPGEAEMAIKTVKKDEQGNVVSDLPGPGPTVTFNVEDLLSALGTGLAWVPAIRPISATKAVVDMYRKLVGAANDKKAAWAILNRGVETGHLTEAEKNKILDEAPSDKYETPEEKVARQVKADKAAQAANAGAANAPADGAAPSATDPYTAALTAHLQAQAAEATAHAAERQAQTARQPLIDRANVAISYLTQQIAAGRLSSDQAQAELERYKTQTGFEVGRAQEIGRRVESAQEQTLKALPFQAPPNAAYLPGFEPGGPLARVGQIAGFNFNPEQFRAPFTQFNPYNQALPMANQPVPQGPAIPDFLKTALGQGGTNGFDLAMAALRALGQGGTTGQAPPWMIPQTGVPQGTGRIPSSPGIEGGT